MTFSDKRIAAFNKEEGPWPIAKPNGKASKHRLKLIPFDQIKPRATRRHLVKGIVPRVGLVVVWEPPKCGKSFWVFDLMMHVALGWEYRGHRVHQGPVIYCAFEGQTGIEDRVEAFRQKFMAEDHEAVPFYLEPITMNLVRDCAELVSVIQDDLGGKKPVGIVLDTLNRSMQGSESSDEDMSAYIRAADVLRETFECAVIIVHHCGVEGTRPRGHTSLTGAVEAQLAVKRNHADKIIVELEYVKDGPQGEQIASTLEVVDIGLDEDGDVKSSCVILPAEMPKQTQKETKLNPNQQTAYAMLREAGTEGIKQDDWYSRLKEIGIGARRRATLTDISTTLRAKGLARVYAGRWNAT